MSNAYVTTYFFKANSFMTYLNIFWSFEFDSKASKIRVNPELVDWIILVCGWVVRAATSSLPTPFSCDLLRPCDT